MVSDAKLVISDSRVISHGDRSKGVPRSEIVPWSNQVRVVAVSLPQLTQASFLQKNQTLQNRFLISVTLRWHRVSVACKNQSF